MRYATLKQQTWIYRRHYPKDVGAILGLGALKQSLKTGDVKVASERVAEINVRFDETVRRVRAGLDGPSDQPKWAKSMDATIRAIDWSPVPFADLRKSVAVGELAKIYLRLKARELEPGGYKSVRYSVGLFVSRHKETLVATLGRDDGKAFLADIAGLSSSLGKSYRNHGLPLDVLLRESSGCHDPITVVTQRRIWSQVRSFVNWVLYEGHLEADPFQTVRFEGKGGSRSYAVPTDAEVLILLAAVDDDRLGALLLLCLLTGMRLGEAVGLLREDLVTKGNLGVFVKVRPNRLRKLKTLAAEREVPLHSTLLRVLEGLPSSGPLFPGVSVNMMTKAFAKLRDGTGRDHLVFHGTRKWFITACERTGTPEYFTASLVGHKAARSGNGITYAIYSGGISDDQKRGIIDQIRLPA
jgi:integrase